MNKKNKALKIIGLCLIGLQILSLIGLVKGRGLYLSGSSIYSTPLPAGLNIVKLAHAIEAGHESFIISFRDLFTFSEDWVPPTATQAMSGYIRDSLQDGGLFIYDALLTISYAFTGIMGVVLLDINAKITRKNEEGGYGDKPPISSSTEQSWEKFLK